jgi:hypothetical protein
MSPDGGRIERQISDLRDRPAAMRAELVGRPVEALSPDGRGERGAEVVAATCVWAINAVGNGILIVADSRSRCVATRALLAAENEPSRMGGRHRGDNRGKGRNSGE